MENILSDTGPWQQTYEDKSRSFQKTSKQVCFATTNNEMREMIS